MGLRWGWGLCAVMVSSFWVMDPDALRTARRGYWIELLHLGTLSGPGFGQVGNGRGLFSEL
jgi:hypothetical protein